LARAIRAHRGRWGVAARGARGFHRLWRIPRSGDARGLAKGEAARSGAGQGAEVATRSSSYQGRRNSGFGGCDASMDSSTVRTDGPATISLQRVIFKRFWQLRAGSLRSGAVLRGASVEWPVLLFAGLLAGA